MADTADLAAGRVTYREGQRLTARDLVDDRARRMRLRQLHVRHLHETWGIATGFDVQAARPSAVAVGPGYALDHFARDLVLSASIVIPVPMVAGPEAFVLVATFLQDCAFPTSVAGAAVCLNAPLHPRRERPAFAWRTIAELELGAMVPVCHVVVENNAIKGAVQTRVRRYARRLVRPHVATGVTDPDRSLWHEWWQRDIYNGYYQRVDTTDGGFTGTPQYFAQLVVVKPSDHTETEVREGISQAYGHIRETARDSFVFQAVVPEKFRMDLWERWAISWIGVQPMKGCPPVLNLSRLLTLAGHLYTIK